MSVLGNRIKSLRKARNLNQTQLAEALNTQFDLNIDRVMVSKWETDYQTPVMHTVICLAKFFNVSLDYLNGNSYVEISPDRFPPPDLTDDYVTFPVIGEIAAGFDHIVNEDWEGDKINIPTESLAGRDRNDYMVLRVKGDSMYPMYQDGDKVLILKQSTLDYSGQVGAVLYEDEHTSLKKVEYADGEDWIRLVPINPNVAPEKIEGERLEHCRILGIPKLLIRHIEN